VGSGPTFHHREGAGKRGHSIDYRRGTWGDNHELTLSTQRNDEDIGDG
jgi:hypothetical protein